MLDTAASIRLSRSGASILPGLKLLSLLGEKMPAILSVFFRVGCERNDVEEIGCRKEVAMAGSGKCFSFHEDVVKLLDAMKSCDCSTRSKHHVLHLFRKLSCTLFPISRCLVFWKAFQKVVQEVPEELLGWEGSWR